MHAFRACLHSVRRLWESAQKTAHSLPARLAVEHCVHEARGLDVLPLTVQKFRGNGDAASASLLEDVIYAVSRGFVFGGGGGWQAQGCVGVCAQGVGGGVGVVSRAQPC